MSYTPHVKEMQVLEQGGVAFPPVAGWIDSVQSSSSPASINLTTVRSNMGMPAGLPLFVILAADGPFWANFNATAAIPAGNTTDGSSSEFAPNQRYLDASVTSISFISANDQNISLQFFRP